MDKKKKTEEEGKGIPLQFSKPGIIKNQKSIPTPKKTKIGRRGKKQ